MDAFFSVLAVRQLERPLNVAAEGYSMEAPRHLFFHVTPECADRLRTAPLERSHGGETIDEVLNLWHAQHGLDVASADLRTVSQLPSPIAELVACDWWAQLAFDSRFTCAEATALHCFWEQLGRSANDGPTAEPDFDAMRAAEASQTGFFKRPMFLQIAEYLRKWSPSILVGVVDHVARVATELLLSTFVELLDSCVVALNPSSFQSWTW